jgi:hypothetical protein
MQLCLLVFDLKWYKAKIVFEGDFIVKDTIQSLITRSHQSVDLRQFNQIFEKKHRTENSHSCITGKRSV